MLSMCTGRVGGEGKEEVMESRSKRTEGVNGLGW